MSDFDEIVFAIGHARGKDVEATLTARCAELRAISDEAGTPMPAIRLALPVFTRERDFGALRTAVKHMVNHGIDKWEAADLATLRMLRALGLDDITADWTLYAFNSAARQALADLGIRRHVASPESYHLPSTESRSFPSAESRPPMSCAAGASLPLTEHLIRQSTPLFISLTRPAHRRHLLRIPNRRPVDHGAHRAAPLPHTATRCPPPHRPFVEPLLRKQLLTCFPLREGRNSLRPLPHRRRSPSSWPHHGSAIPLRPTRPRHGSAIPLRPIWPRHGSTMARSCTMSRHGSVVSLNRTTSLSLPMAVGLPLQYLSTFKYHSNTLLTPGVRQDKCPGRKRSFRHVLARIGDEIGKVRRRRFLCTLKRVHHCHADFLRTRRYRRLKVTTKRFRGFRRFNFFDQALIATAELVSVCPRAGCDDMALAGRGCPCASVASAATATAKAISIFFISFFLSLFVGVIGSIDFH